MFIRKTDDHLVCQSVFEIPRAFGSFFFHSSYDWTTRSSHARLTVKFSLRIKFRDGLNHGTGGRNPVPGRRSFRSPQDPSEAIHVRF